ncbi:MAG: Rho termination factor N-terminal domain-containing protein [Mycoplasmatota bacterium]
MANAVVQAAGGTLVDYVTSTKDDSDIMQKAVESVKRREEKPRRDFKNNRRDFKPNFQKREFVKREDRKPFVKQEKEVVTEQKEIKPEAKVEVKKEAQDLTQLTVTQLRDLANEKNVKVNSTMKKAELIDALK